MKRPGTFDKGGITPRDRKEATHRLPIKNAHIPAVAVVPLVQHTGAPAQSIVNPGDEVKEGMLIARASGFVSANIHAPVPGRVIEIREIILPQGIKSQAVVIECAGEFDRSGKVLEKQSWDDLDGAGLNAIIAEMGVVGLGGAAFPAHVKFSVRTEKPIEVLVINGVECEPFLTVDHRLMLEKPAEIIEGARIVQKIIGAARVIVAVEENKPDAIEVLNEKIRENNLPFMVVPLKMRYPQGDEKMVLKAALHREVPSGGLPLDVGAVVSNVHTTFAVYEAVVWRKPLIERVITVTGPALAQPSNIKARIGTKIGELLEDCGGFVEPPAKIVMGGPMMGWAVADLDTPLVKGASGIIAFSKKEMTIYASNPCIRCGRCIRVCPWGLLPTVLFKLLDLRRFTKALEDGLMDCKECGCCAYVCPARIPLVHAFRTGKILARSEKK
jgi:electron transport complex protein RnfC